MPGGRKRKVEYGSWDFGIDGESVEVYADQAGLSDDMNDPAVRNEFLAHMADLESAQLRANEE